MSASNLTLVLEAVRRGKNLKEQFETLQDQQETHKGVERLAAAHAQRIPPTREEVEHGESH